MKNSRIATISVLLLAVMVSLNATVYAQNGYGKVNKSGTGPGFFCKNIPDITEDQQGKIDALRTDHMKTMQSLRNQKNEKRAHLQTLRTADKADMNAINKTIDEIGALQTKMMKERENHIQEVRNLLTDEQRISFDSHKRGNGPGQGYCRGNGPGRGTGNKQRVRGRNNW
jgi:Spy/CpxP family protein refolding chaperone